MDDVIFILYYSTETWTTSRKLEKNHGYFIKQIENSFRVSTVIETRMMPF